MTVAKFTMILFALTEVCLRDGVNCARLEIRNLYHPILIGSEELFEPPSRHIAECDDGGRPVRTFCGVWSEGLSISSVGYPIRSEERLQLWDTLS